MPVVRGVFGAVGLVVSLACVGSGSSTRQVDVRVSVNADPGVPLAGVPVRVDGHVSGQTDPGGLLRIRLFGAGRREVRIEPVCPDGYKQPEEPAVLRLRSYSAAEARSILEIDLSCRPAQRRAVFVVRAMNAPGITVRLDGDVVAYTNQDGVAHFSRSALAGTEYLLELDAKDHRALLPRNTAHQFQLPEADEIFIVEQKFEKASVARKSRALRRPRITRIE